MATGRSAEHEPMGWLRTLINYSKTTKGRHDLIDYARAAAIILATSLMIGLIIWSITPI